MSQGWPFFSVVVILAVTWTLLASVSVACAQTSDVPEAPPGLLVPGAGWMSCDHAVIYRDQVLLPLYDQLSTPEAMKKNERIDDQLREFLQITKQALETQSANRTRAWTRVGFLAADLGAKFALGMASKKLEHGSHGQEYVFEKVTGDAASAALKLGEMSLLDEKFERRSGQPVVEPHESLRYVADSIANYADGTVPSAKAAVWLWRAGTVAIDTSVIAGDWKIEDDLQEALIADTAEGIERLRRNPDLDSVNNAKNVIDQTCRRLELKEPEQEELEQLAKDLVWDEGSLDEELASILEGLDVPESFVAGELPEGFFERNAVRIRNSKHYSAQVRQRVMEEGVAAMSQYVTNGQGRRSSSNCPSDLSYLSGQIRSSSIRDTLGTSLDSIVSGSGGASQALRGAESSATELERWIRETQASGRSDPQTIQALAMAEDTLRVNRELASVIRSCY